MKNHDGRYIPGKIVFNPMSTVINMKAVGEVPELNTLANECYAVGKEKGFWNAAQMGTEPLLIATKLGLIGSEVSEALEAYRSNDDEGFKYELADIIIRTLDLAGHLGIDIDSVVREKIAKNKIRPYMHGKRF